MSTENDDIESLLADILDDSKPMPVQSTKATAKAVVNVATNAAPRNVGDAVLADPESFLESLMAEDSATPPTPMDVAEATEIGSELVLADVTQSVTPPIFQPTPGPAATIIKMPVFTAADFAATMDIRAFATLVTLNTNRWHAKVKDRQASKDAATASEANEGAFETRKRLLVGADGMLKTIHKSIDEARAVHYEMTLPWSTTSLTDVGRRTGGRLLPNTLFQEYIQAMGTKKQAMQAALAAFIPEYPNLIALAKKQLGKRFDPREYPNPSSIAQHFDLSFDFQPIPKGEDFGGLPQAQLDALASKVNENTRLMAENAMQDVWVRLLEAVGRMAERLSSPDKMFHDSLVSNVRDVARLLAHLNVTQDTKVEKLRAKVEKYLCAHEPKDIRKSNTLRTEIGAHATSILQEMNK